MSAVEGVWSKDIEEAFEEALAVYPPCGRRKIILSDEGKMYGRNELIARYIKMRTGKTRTRKQVSSHIQVLSRKRGRDQQKNKQASPQLSRQSDSSTEPPLSVVSTYTGHSQSPSVTWSTNARPYLPQFISPDSKLSLTAQPEDVMQPITQNQSQALHNQILYTPLSNPTLSLASARQYSESVRLVLSELAVAFEYVDESSVRNYHCVAEIKGFSLYAPPLEAVNANLLFPKLPGLRELFQRGPKDAFFLAKVACNIDLPPVDGFYTLSSKYQAIGREAPIKCSLKLFLAGRLEVEKILVGIPESQVSMGASQYSFQHSPLCDAAVSLMNTLRQQPSKEEADEILAGVTALLSVYDRQLHQTLFVMVLVFHTTPHAARCQLLRLV